jgi:indolepyruvate ferredoxin oxidoreductase
MVQWMDRDTSTFTQMGGEGTSWIGQAPFTSRAHVFVNLGDGTYAHSGILAIRAARSAGVNITYQILYNDAVAMTGGQNAEGGFTPLDIIRQLRAEGIDAIALVAEEPERYLNVPLPEGVTLDGRDAHEAVQRRLREVSGVSVILFDQVCAAEKRRRRKRGLMPASTRFAMINEAVCEGCGDCGIKSNCVSLVPVETALGRKRAVDQSSCNQDLSCVDGFCPSFVTIEGAVRRSGRAGADVPRPPVTPLPTADPDGRTAIVIGGIGGTGVVTVGALIGMAAHLEAKGVAILDQIGLAQKGGEVSSHIQIARRPEDIGPVRLTAGEADLLIGCDLVVAANPSILALLTPTALAIVNSHATMTSQFTSNPELTFPGEELLERIRSRARVVSFDLAEIATRIFGDSTAANILALGMAWQTGRIPLRLESIERAIALNGTAVASNTSAFHWGRALAYSPDAALTRLNPDRTPARPQTLDEQIAYRRKHLAAYQDDQLADRFARLVQKVRTAEERTVPGQTALTASVCHTYHRLLAIKDEYEVARLMRSPAFKDAIKSEFEGGRVFYHLAPPILGKRDPLTGQLLKRKFGPSVQIVFALLERLKILRGTPLDVFSYMEERRVERALIGEFESVMEEVVLALTPELHQVSVDLVDSFGRIRGYGHVKASSIRAARERIDALRLELRQIARPASPVASSIVNGEPRVAGHV